MKAQEAVKLAWQHHTIVPAFNIPYLPMAKPVAQAIIDEKTVAMLQVARLEWEKFAHRGRGSGAGNRCQPDSGALGVDAAGL